MYCITYADVNNEQHPAGADPAALLGHLEHNPRQFEYPAVAHGRGPREGEVQGGGLPRRRARKPSRSSSPQRPAAEP